MGDDQMLKDSYRTEEFITRNLNNFRSFGRRKSSNLKIPNPNTAPKQKSLSFLRGFSASLFLLKPALGVRFSVVPGIGLEPIRPQWTQDFKSCKSGF